MPEIVRDLPLRWLKEQGEWWASYADLDRLLTAVVDELREHDDGREMYAAAFDQFREIIRPKGDPVLSGVMIGCLGCHNGVPYEEAQGWEYTTDTGWLCPDCQDGRDQEAPE